MYTRHTGLVLSVFVTAALASQGCAQSAAEEVVEAESISGEEGDALASTTRPKVLADMTAALTTATGASLKGAAFLRRGDKLVFVVDRFAERGDDVLLFATAMGRRTTAQGRSVDYHFRKADYVGSKVETAIAQGAFDQGEFTGPQLRAYVRKTGTSYVPVKVGSPTPYALLEFGSTDTNLAAMYCEGSKKGFTQAEMGAFTALATYCL